MVSTQKRPAGIQVDFQTDLTGPILVGTFGLTISMAPRLIKRWAGMIPLARRILRRPGASAAGNGAGIAPRPQSFHFPAGHFYSPVPSLDEVERDAERIFSVPNELPGIDLNIDEQLSTLSAMAEYYHELPFQAEKSRGLRYSFRNPMFGYSDAICLYGMIRHLKPKRIIEVGAGYSSCVMLDTNERFFEHTISCTFIEPN